jgi:hypothetical protein
MGDCTDGCSARWRAIVPPRVGTQGERKTMWNAVRNESRELIWLASMVSGLSLLGVGFAVGLALVLVGIP